jgi:hypothetical protein
MGMMSFGYSGQGFRVRTKGFLLRICPWVAAVLFLSPQVLDAGNVPATQWFPLQKDNVWVLQLTNTETRIISCLQDSQSQALVRGLFKEDVEMRANSSGALLGLGSRRHWQTLFRFNRRNSLKWGFNLTGGSCSAEQANWTTNKETVVTPAGTFAGCRHLNLAALTMTNSSCGAVDPSELWFAPGVGPVALKSANGDLYLLSSAKIGKQSLPPATNGVVATLASDQDSYVNVAFGIVCPPCVTATPPCEVPCRIGDPVTATAHFTFEVINQSPDPAIFTFPTTQQFDIDLIDQSGVLVKAWSDGQAFGNIVTTLAMAPGQTNTYSGDISLADRQGKQLNGVYVARAFLTDSSGPTVQATTLITVTLIEP